jgi:hypothetical protein
MLTEEWNEIYGDPKLYFTPKIEDLHIGYICEISRFNKPYFGLFGGIQACHFTEIQAGQAEIRTLYLSKTQIQEEDWQILKKSDNNYIYATKGNYSELRYDIIHNTLAIYNTIDALNKTITLPAFYGECKCINQFRYIINLLKIN